MVKFLVSNAENLNDHFMFTVSPSELHGACVYHWVALMGRLWNWVNLKEKWKNKNKQVKTRTNVWWKPQGHTDCTLNQPLGLFKNDFTDVTSWYCVLKWLTVEREGGERPSTSLLLCQHTSAAEEMGLWSREERSKPWRSLCAAWLTACSVCCERGQESSYVDLLSDWLSRCFFL